LTLEKKAPENDDPKISRLHFRQPSKVTQIEKA